MKIAGREIERPEGDIIAFPRKSGDIVFRVDPVMDLDEFETIVPLPKPRMARTKRGLEPIVDDEQLTIQMDNYGKAKLGYILFKSIRPVGKDDDGNEVDLDIEYEHIDPEQPMTYASWEQELRDSGLTTAEYNRLLQMVMEVNMLTEKRLDEARASFLQLHIPQGA